MIAGTAGALFLTYLLLPPIWSALSFSLRGYKGTCFYYENELLHVCKSLNIFETRINNDVFCLNITAFMLNIDQFGIQVINV